MKVTRGAFALINVIVVLLLLAGIAGTTWFMLNFNLDTEGVQKQAEYERLKASANLYYSRLGFYDGVCSDIGIGASMRCSDSGNTFALEETVSRGSFFCMDSSGFMGNTRISKGEGTECRK